MARPRGGPHTDETSKPVATRLPLDIHERALALAGGKDGLAAWLRGVIKDAVGARSTGLGASQRAGYEEGVRQGWAAGNAALREALKAAYEKLK